MHLGYGSYGAMICPIATYSSVYITYTHRSDLVQKQYWLKMHPKARVSVNKLTCYLVLIAVSLLGGQQKTKKKIIYSF